MPSWPASLREKLTVILKRVSLLILTLVGELTRIYLLCISVNLELHINFHKLCEARVRGIRVLITDNFHRSLWSEVSEVGTYQLLFKKKMSEKVMSV